MRRPLRWLFNGLGKALCLLSLLACVGTAWLWSLENRGGSPWVEVVAFRTRVWSLYDPKDGLRVIVVRHWPERPGAWAGGDYNHPESWPEELPAAVVDEVTAPPQDGKTYLALHGDWQEPPVRTKRFAGIRFTWTGYQAAHLRDDGAVVRVRKGERSTWMRDPSKKRWSDPLPRYILDDMPPWLPVGSFALPPLLWLAFPGRRRRVLRRRRRLGLCLRCGYDLTGNTTGRCSECGEAVQAERRVAQ